MEEIRPIDLDLSNAKNEQEINDIKNKVSDWIESIKSDLTSLLSDKNGVEHWVVMLEHKGSKKPIMITNGHVFNITRLSIFGAKKSQEALANAIES